MPSTLLENGTLLDVVAGERLPGRHVLIRDGRLAEVSDRPITATGHVDVRIDLRGKTIMPGLCDAHVHVTQLASNLTFLRDAAPSYVAAQSSVVLRDTVRRGFTTVRDAAGADYGLAAAVDDGLFEGPRILFAGHALSQTGGHADMRSKGQDRYDFCPSCLGRTGRVCDGPIEVRRAARDELRKGASQVKIMVSGGVTSPLDRIESMQFSAEEIRAAVEEAEAQDRYVMAHAYTSRSINRALECGVRSIEHGNMMDEATAAHIRDRDAFLVPTVVVYWAMQRFGAEIGIPAMFQDKVAIVHEAAMRGLEIATRAGVRMVFGTDLFGDMLDHQSHEFSLRAEIQSPMEIIRAATSTAAELFNMVGEIGVIAPGARADLLVIDGDPVADLNLLQGQGRHMSIIMKDGAFVVNRL
jgi:imidazolonepropionase-like amidohydrolase